MTRKELKNKNTEESKKLYTRGVYKRKNLTNLEGVPPSQRGPLGNLLKEDKGNR